MSKMVGKKHAIPALPLFTPWRQYRVGALRGGAVYLTEEEFFPEGCGYEPSKAVDCFVIRRINSGERVASDIVLAMEWDEAVDMATAILMHAAKASLEGKT